MLVFVETLGANVWAVEGVTIMWEAVGINGAASAAVLVVSNTVTFPITFCCCFIWGYGCYCC